MPDRNDDREARRAWIQRALDDHQQGLTRFATGLLRGDVERARDVVQEAFLKLWQADRAAIDDHLAAWLYTVCRNRAHDIARKESRMNLVPDPRPDGVAESPLEHLSRQQRAGQAVQALAHLPARQQELVRLKFQGGLSYREIAEVTGLSVSNVGYLLHTAIKAVRREIGGEA